MGFAALSVFFFLLALTPGAIWLWAYLFHRRYKKRTFPLVAFLQAKPQIAFVLCGLALTLLSESLRLALPPEARRGLLAFSVVGFASFVFGIAFATRAKLPGAVSQPLSRVSKWLQVTPTQSIFLFSSIVVAFIAARAAGDGLAMRTPLVAVSAVALALSFVILGAWPLAAKPVKFDRRALLWALGLAFLAFLLRGLYTSLIPNTLTGDEASGGLFAVEYLSGKFSNPFTFGWYSFPAFYFWIQALSISLFGQTTMALRITSALAGSLTVGALYLAGRAFYGHRAGMLAALFLAGSHFHIHFSRIGLNNIWDGFWYTVILGLLWWAWKHQNRVGFLLAGVALGLSQYFYVSVRLLFVLLPLWCMLMFFARKAEFRQNRSNVLLMFLIAMVIFIPLATNYALHFDQFMAPMQRVSLLGSWLQNETQISGLPAWRILAEKLWISAQAFTSANLQHWYTPEVPILRPAAAVFFIFGFAILLISISQPQHWLLILWLGAFVLSGGLSESTPAAQRYIGAAPAAALLLGYALDQIALRLTGLWSAGKRVFAAAAVIAVLLLAAGDLRFYFDKFTHRGDYAGTNTAIAQYLANQLQEYPAGTQVAFFGQPRMGYLSLSSLPFLAPHIRGVDMPLEYGSPENPVLDTGTVIYVFLPEYASSKDALLAEHPSAQARETYGINRDFLYWWVELN
jgi:4-amino-4-deoxy-L-arabinose transferase-like glycosyltransferase